MCQNMRRCLFVPSYCRSSHDLVLCQTTMSICIHAVATTTGGKVLDEAKTKRSTAVLISLEFRNCRLSRVHTVEAHNAGTPRSAAVLVLDFGLLNFSNCCKQFDQVLIASRPW